MSNGIAEWGFSYITDFVSARLTSMTRTRLSTRFDLLRDPIRHGFDLPTSLKKSSAIYGTPLSGLLHSHHRTESTLVMMGNPALEQCVSSASFAAFDLDPRKCLKKATPSKLLEPSCAHNALYML